MSPSHHPGGREPKSQKALRLATFRVSAFVWLSKDKSAPIKGFTFASDLSRKGASFYLPKRLSPGAKVRVAFEDPEGATFGAFVSASSRVSLRQGFIGHDALAYRAAIQYQFVSEAERQRYLKFFESLKERIFALDGAIHF